MWLWGTLNVVLYGLVSFWKIKSIWFGLMLNTSNIFWLFWVWKKHEEILNLVRFILLLNQIWLFNFATIGAVHIYFFHVCILLGFIWITSQITSHTQSTYCKYTMKTTYRCTLMNIYSDDNRAYWALRS